MSASFQSYQSIFCLRLLKPLKSTITFLSYKNCPRKILLPALGGNLAFIFTFPCDHRVLLVQRDHKWHLSADLSAEKSGAEGKAHRSLLLASSPLLGPRRWLTGVVLSTWSPWHGYSVCQDSFYLILLTTVDLPRDF